MDFISLYDHCVADDLCTYVNINNTSGCETVSIFCWLLVITMSAVQTGWHCIYGHHWCGQVATATASMQTLLPPPSSAPPLPSPPHCLPDQHHLHHLQSVQEELISGVARWSWREATWWERQQSWPAIPTLSPLSRVWSALRSLWAAIRWSYPTQPLPLRLWGGLPTWQETSSITSPPFSPWHGSLLGQIACHPSCVSSHKDSECVPRRSQTPHKVRKAELHRFCTMGDKAESVSTLWTTRQSQTLCFGWLDTARLHAMGYQTEPVSELCAITYGQAQHYG